MTQEQLRNKLVRYTGVGTQSYVAEQTGINSGILSRFKNGKIDLYPELFQKLCDFFENDK